MLNAIMLSVVMLSVVMLSVVLPYEQLSSPSDSDLIDTVQSLNKQKTLINKMKKDRMDKL
jgi:hypothetical protein